jgi:hypothetical protein
MNRQAEATRKVEDMALGQAVEKACRKGRQKPAIPDKDDVRHRGFGDMACHIQHEGIVMSATGSCGPRQGSGHVEPRAFRRRRRRIGRGAPPIRQNQAQSAGPVPKGGLHRPVPGRDGGMDPAPLCGNGDAFTAAPGDRPNIGVLQSASPKHGLGGGLKIIDQPWQRVAEKFGRALQASEMLLAQKQTTVIGADNRVSAASTTIRVPPLPYKRCPAYRVARARSDPCLPRWPRSAAPRRRRSRTRSRTRTRGN